MASPFVFTPRSFWFILGPPELIFCVPGFETGLLLIFHSGSSLAPPIRSPYWY
jgi:hypothetical protein